MSGLPIWQNGIRFECQQSGGCCTSRGEYGYIYLTPEDTRNLATHLGLDLAIFRRTHCQKTMRLLHLRDPDKDCQFLTGKRCSVYSARPLQCRTWPFWPENFDNLRTWNEDVVAFCPGIGKGRLHAPHEIKEILELHDNPGDHTDTNDSTD
ncbi:MAG: YkgJ family cysteine cluster protein [Myxococcota bacterium]